MFLETVYSINDVPIRLTDERWDKISAWKKQFLSQLFILHDLASAFLIQHFLRIKMLILLLAHASLLGFFFPETRNQFGSMGFGLIIFILFLSPLSKIFRTRLLLQLMTFRRELGIFFAYVVTVHGVGHLTDPIFASFFVTPYFPGEILAIPLQILAGMAAYFLTLPLLLSSNNWTQKHLGKNWKRLHRLVYLVFIFGMIHAFTIKGGFSDIVSVIDALLLIGFYGLLKLLAWKNFLPPLSRLIERVALTYQNYREERKNSLSA